MLESTLFQVLHVLKKWNKDYDLNLEKIKLTSGSPHTARLTTDDNTIEIAVEGLINTRISIDFILDDLLTHSLMRNEKQDNRVPEDLRHLAEEVAAIWHTLDRVKLLQSRDGKLEDGLVELFDWFEDSNIVNLFEKFISRDDLSDRDEIFIVLE